MYVDRCHGFSSVLPLETCPCAFVVSGRIARCLQQRSDDVLYYLFSVVTRKIDLRFPRNVSYNHQNVENPSPEHHDRPQRE